MKGFVPPVNEQERVVQKRVADAVKAVCHTGMSKHTGFLNSREIELAQAELNRQRWEYCSFEGGYAEAERRVLSVFEPGAKEQVVPIETIYVRVQGKNGAEGLTHRDYLGALLGCGVKRDCIGDILPDAQGALVYLLPQVLPYIEQQLNAVGRQEVAVERQQLPRVQQAPPAREAKTASVASLRLDAVLAAMLNLSRTQAAGMIQRELVQINHLPVSTLHHSIDAGDVFSIRGVGKYKLSSVGGKSRKNRIFIEYLQY